MSPQARTGLVAFGIVGGVFLAVGLAAGVLVVANRPGVTSPGEERPAPPDPKTDPEGYVRNHRWWAKPLTPKQLDKLLAYIVATNDGYSVWYDQNGNTLRLPSGDSREAWPSDLPAWMESKRKWTVGVTGGRRWDRPRALNELVSSLDLAEFNKGAGRP